MAKKKTGNARVSEATVNEVRSTPSRAENSLESRGLFESVMQPSLATGRRLLVVNSNDKDALDTMLKRLSDKAGVRKSASGLEIASAAGGSKDMDEVESIVIEDFGIVILDADPDQTAAAVAASNSDSLYITEQEMYCYTANFDREVAAIGALHRQYLQGYRAAVIDLTDRLLGEQPPNLSPSISQAVSPDFAFGASVPSLASGNTWGLDAIGIDNTSLDGAGVRVAVLDTGIDLTHPDFNGRVAGQISYVRGQAVQDGHGHGTHCAGTACGPRQTAGGVRYGVAGGAELYIAKVLGNDGRGREGDVALGMQWARRQGCRVISVSIQSAVRPGQGYLASYEQAGRSILDSNGLCIAAAGNHSNRLARQYVPVAGPANCPSIVSVGGIDRNGAMYNRSNRAINGNGGHVDFVAPGVGVYSSDVIGRYNQRTGTSQATPHVAGIAALMLQTNPDLSGLQLYTALRLASRPLSRNVEDNGHGLVQVPS